MRIDADWHIHSRNSCDEASLIVADLIVQAEKAGIVAYGLTDHLNTPFNLPDIAASREEFLKSEPPPFFHFGVEVSAISQWELELIRKGGVEKTDYGIRSGGPAGGPLAVPITEEDIERFGIEYVIGGTHWPMYVPFERDQIIRDYHRQNMFLATHQLVDIVAHPWWWMGHWKDANGRYTAEPWFDDFRRIPASMHDEFAAAVVEHGTVVEINLGAMLLNPQYPKRFAGQYLEYLAGLKAAGVRFSLGSDCHDPHYVADFAKAATMLATVGIRDHDCWRLPPRS